MMPKFIREATELENTDIWYKNTSYEDAKELVKKNLLKTVSSFIAAGYWLKRIRDSRDYEMDGYTSLWECAESEFGLKVSEASRAMSMNDKYSIDGNSPFIQDTYKNYNKSQLQEMLTMSDEQIEQVSPDMSIKDIRKIKNPETVENAVDEPEESVAVEEKICQEAAGVSESCDVATDSVNTESEEDFSDDVVEDVLTEIEMTPEQEEPLNVEFDTEELMKELDGDVIDGEYVEVTEDVPKADEESDESNDNAVEPEKLSAYGLCKTKYPEGSLLTSEGCGHKYNCFICAQTCDIRQEMRYCVEAHFENPYGCTTMNVLENIKTEIGDSCQFINLDIAELKASKEPNPCCKKCQVKDCGYRCQKSVLDKNNFENDISETINKSEAVTVSANDDYDFLSELLKKENNMLSEMIKISKVEKIPEELLRKQKLIVGALANMKYELEMMEENEVEETVQPELPVFRNNEQRRAWIEDVEAWGLWYEDHNIQARYYKYDFPDGSRLIAVKYRYTCPSWLMNDVACLESDGDYKNTEYHMIFSEEYRENASRDRLYAYYQKYFTHETISISALIEFIKKIAKRQQASKLPEEDQNAIADAAAAGQETI